MSNCQTKKQLKIAIDALDAISQATWKVTTSMTREELFDVVNSDQIEAASALEAIKAMGEPCSKIE